MPIPRLAAAVIVLSLPSAAQTPTIQSVVNAGSFDARLSPGVVAMIGGSNFGNAAQGVTVQVNGINAPVNFVTPSTISTGAP